jgi:hypothetical protein
MPNEIFRDVLSFLDIEVDYLAQIPTVAEFEV